MINICLVGTLLSRKFFLDKYALLTYLRLMVKIPLKYAKLLGVNKSFLVRVNQGKRRLSLGMALNLLIAAEAEGEKFALLDLRPDLLPLLPYLCNHPAKSKRSGSKRQQRKRG